MNEQHVQGRLNYRYSGKEVGQGGVRYCDLIIPSDTGHPHTTLASMIPQPDARRLSACWNACEQASTEDLEIHGQLWTTAFIMNANMAKELAAARALLEEAQFCVDNSGVLSRIRAFLNGGK